MVVNFIARRINQNTRKLVQTFTLIIIIIIIIIIIKRNTFDWHVNVIENDSWSVFYTQSSIAQWSF
jgi:hypothetical protein